MSQSPNPPPGENGVPNCERNASGIISMPCEESQKQERFAWPGVWPFIQSVMESYMRIHGILPNRQLVGVPTPKHG